MKRTLKYINNADENYLQGVLSLIEEFEETGSIEVQSSGSTGPAKTFTFSKEQVEHSVSSTLDYFSLKEGDVALLALSLDYVAAKLMVLRAYLGGLQLVIAPPSSNPFKYIDKSLKIHFAPLVPLQVKTLLESEPEKLQSIDQVLIGGASLDKKLKEQLIQLPNNYFQSFGMAETLTHFALKRLEESNYHCLQGIELSQDENGNAIIHAPGITGQKAIKTNDRVALKDRTTFQWLGRSDYLVNTGGHKVHPETVENRMKSSGLNTPFFVTGTPDAQLGEKVVLICEQEPDEEMLKTSFKEIHPYSIPRELYIAKNFIRTNSGKIKRALTFDRAEFKRKLTIEK